MKFSYKDGAWDEGQLVEGEPYIKVHIAATGLHYGQSCFEGLKAFAQKDGSVALFRPDENAKRMQSSGGRTLMPALDTATFVEACRRVTADNLAFVPPYGSGGALYLRPLLFGSGPRIGLSPADEYVFLVMAMPVGDYYKGGLATPVKAVVVEGFDRAAPQGVGGVKVAGNYAADILPNTQNKQKGFPISLYLDAKTQSYIEEFSTSNFFGIKPDGKTYVTPASAAVLPSITNKSLMALATAAGLKVEQRAVKVEELADFTEVCACGTAVVITPVGSVTHGAKVYTVGAGAGADASVGPVSKQLYSTMRAIQTGEEAGPEGWIVKV